MFNIIPFSTMDDATAHSSAAITAAEVMALLSSHPDRVLVLDVRPYSDYVVGHVKSALSVRLSSILLRRLGMNKAKLESVLSSEHKAKYKVIVAAKPVVTVVYDAKTESVDFDNIDKKNPLHVVLTNLIANGFEPRYLQGGYQQVSETYDMCVSAADPGSDSHPFSLGALSLSLPTADALTPSTPIERHVRDKAPSQVLPFLYVGAEGHAQDGQLLKELGITHVLNLTTRGSKQLEGFTYHTIPIRDCWNQNLATRFDDAFAFIDQCHAAGSKILVHCVAGISRSPTVAIAYIMKTSGVTLQEAYSLVKEKRPSVAPNLDFMGELQQYEKELYKTRDGHPSGWDGLQDTGGMHEGMKEAKLIETK
eukprot:m.58787 g.58787  ORF g.58787 m.58787 type:complete len:365 (+) comp13791_c0_seq1:219-1313(+)